MRSDDFTCPPLTAARFKSNITIWPNSEVKSVMDKLSDRATFVWQTREETSYHVLKMIYVWYVYLCWY